MGNTTIEWSDKTWNPTRGCSRVSQGCVNCYAERRALRFAGPGWLGTIGPNHELAEDHPPGPFHGFVTKVNGHAAWTGKVELIESKLLEPLSWKKPARIFVNSMSDLFHEALPDEAIDRVFAVMALCPQHTFQILTKRPARMLEYFSDMGRVGEQVAGFTWDYKLCHTEGILTLPKFPLPNVHLGVSVEDQKTADERIPLLLQTPAAKRFISYEPALSRVDFSRPEFSINRILLGGIDQVICGAESGPEARPFDENWPWHTRDQCLAGGVKFFYKQNARNGKKIPTPELDGRKWMELI